MLNGLTSAEIINALAPLVEKGNAEVITAVLDCLEGEDPNARLAAVQVLAQQPPGDGLYGPTYVIKAVSARLTDVVPLVRMGVINALAKLAEKGNADVIEKVWALLKDYRDPVPDVQTAAKGARAQLNFGSGRTLRERQRGRD